jgi:hypothetical protein
MANKLEIELTSVRPDGFFTWRAKGAKNPKGIVSAQMFNSAKVGDTFKVEVEYLLDGVQITSVLSERERNPLGNDLELFLGKSSEKAQSKKIAFKRPAKPQKKAYKKPGKAGPKQDLQAKRVNRQRPPQKVSKDQPDNDRVFYKREPTKQSHFGRHVKDLYDSLDLARQAILQRLLRGGLAGVRLAIEKQNRQAREKGEPELLEEPVLKIAEELLPQLKRAQFLDQAKEIMESKSKDLKKISRVINSAVILEESDKEVLTALREYFEHVLKDAEEAYLREINELLDVNKTEEALIKSSNPPYRTLKFPVALSEKLAQACLTQLNQLLDNPDKWLNFLQKVSLSPVKRLVRPQQVPVFQDPSQQKMAVALSSQIPNLVKLLGLKIPPPPVRKRVASNPVQTGSNDAGN